MPPPKPEKNFPVPTKKKQVPTENPEIVKDELITKILKYQNNSRFGSIINKELGFKYTRPQLLKQSINSLESILHRIRTHLNTRNMDKVFEHMVKVSAQGYENVVTGFGYNIEGFSDILLSNPAFHDAFERWKIERSIPDVPPSLQLMYIVASTTYIAHVSNAQIISSREKKQEPPIPKIKDEVKKEINERIKSNHKPGDIII